jgi:hypothetical protein
VRSQSSASGDLLARYRRGEHEAVWTELRAHRAIDGDCRAKALVVATETMTRVGRCADLIAERLAANEWVALTGRLHWPPSERDQQIINDIEQFTAALLPPSLARSGTSSGTTTKRSRRPASAWVAPCSRWTPVCPPAHTTYLLKEWKERRSEVDPDLDDPWNLDLAPDYLHKANFSGGGRTASSLLASGPILSSSTEGTD